MVWFHGATRATRLRARAETRRYTTSTQLRNAGALTPKHISLDITCVCSSLVAMIVGLDRGSRGEVESRGFLVDLTVRLMQYMRVEIIGLLLERS